MESWLLLIHRIPREPTAGRVFVWRKLKQLGAIALQDAVWVLPNTARTREHFQWLAAEILELGGEASLWEADQLSQKEDEALRRKFIEPVEIEYRDILAVLKERKFDLEELSKRFQTVRSRDYFCSNLGKQAREALLKAGGDQTK